MDNQTSASRKASRHVRTLRTISILACGMFAAAVHSSTAQARPLLDELHVLLSTYPSLKASMSEADARRAEITYAEADSLPLVSGSGETGFERTDQPENDQIRQQVGLTVTQTLFDGYGTQNRIKASQLNEQVGHADLQSTQNNLLLQGIQAYLDVVLQHKLVGISQRHVEIVQDITDFIAGERETGRMTLADSLQSRARLQQARETLISFDGSRRQSLVRYQTLFGRTPDIHSMDDPIAPTAMTPPNLKDALNYAHDHNTTLSGARLAIDMAGAQRLVGSATSYPRLDLEGAVDFKNDYDGGSGSEEEGTLLLKLSWDLFDGNRTSATEMAAAHRQSAAQSVLYQRELEVAEQVRMAWNSTLTDADRSSTLNEAEAIALEAYNARYALMTTGKETIINVLDTALEVLNVRTALTTADYRHRLSVYRLLHAMGRLSAQSYNNTVMVQPIDLDAANDIAPATLVPSDMTPAPLDTQAPAPSQSSDIFTMPVEATSLAPLAEPIGEAASESQAMAISVPTKGGYLVVLSSNRSEANARNDHKRLSITGSTVEPFDINGKPMYMLVVGPLPEPEARVVQGEAFDAGVLDAWLKKL